jgi:uncharacterized protein (DUF2147 family)
MKTSGPKRYSAFSLPYLAFSFGAVAGLFGDALRAEEPLPAPETPTMTETGHTFWKHPDYDAVVEVWADATKGLRGRVASLNPADKKIREMVGKILKKEEKLVSDKDVLSFVGMEGDLHLHREGLKWTGSIYWPFKEKSYGVDVEQKGDTLHVHGFFLWMPLLGKSAELTPAKPPGPKTP